ncbi:hypothetical protein NTGBS_770015 [Candidatus Nitrotoga sp. BS]|nr:hypothetical protein NTGBS_770015 [Candidatus Nitrotoga sp. BS]
MTKNRCIKVDPRAELLLQGRLHNPSAYLANITKIKDL